MYNFVKKKKLFWARLCDHYHWIRSCFLLKRWSCIKDISHISGLKFAFLIVFCVDVVNRIWGYFFRGFLFFIFTYFFIIIFILYFLRLTLHMSSSFQIWGWGWGWVKWNKIWWRHLDRKSSELPNEPLVFFVPVFFEILFQWK